LRPPVATVAVVGGGPAGLEAARSLAVAGYAVELFEGAQRLGGQFRMACRIPGKEDFARTIEYFEHELAALGVSVWLGTRVADAGALSAFDAVVVAAGVRPRELALPGVGLPHVRSYASVLLDDGEGAGCDAEVAIIGAGGIGVDVAHLLSATGEGTDRTAAFYARYGLRVAPAPEPGTRTPLGGPTLGATWPTSPLRRTITLMRRGGRIGEGIGPSTRWVAVQELEQAGVELLTGVQYERIEADAVVVTTAEGMSRRIAAQTVVIAAGQEPETGLLDALADADVPRIAVGGAAGTERLNAGRAFREGFEAPGAVASALGLRGLNPRG
jgi:2,4-dienoyl-CoA reductase (NADPH2)